MSIRAKGTKLKPFIIFKGKEEKRLYNNLQKFEQVQKGSLVIYTQDNAWMNSNLYCKYIKEVLADYYPKKRKLLILGQCPSHLSEKILYLFEKYVIDFILIPKRMTSILQPLDRCINYPFQKKYRLYFN